MRTATRSTLQTFSLIFVQICGLASMARPAAAHAVDDWHAIASQTIVMNAARGGAVGIVDLAYVQIAVYDAVNGSTAGIRRSRSRFRSAPAWASPEAATTAAAPSVLQWMFSAQAATLDATYAW